MQVVRFLGAGGYGEVYLCKWHACDVAVKSLSPALLTADGFGGGNANEQVGRKCLPGCLSEDIYDLPCPHMHEFESVGDVLGSLMCIA